MRIEKEIEIHRKLVGCPHITLYLGHEQKPNESSLFMEFLPHSLFEIIGSAKTKRREMVSPEELSRCASHVLSGLRFMHSRGIIHGDVKVPTSAW